MKSLIGPTFSCSCSAFLRPGGLLVWNEALAHRQRWHFAKYRKLDTDYMPNHYFAMDGHICTKVKRSQVENARRHRDTQRAMDLENAAQALQAR